MKLCPTCDREFEEDLDACPDDGTPLVTAGRANNPRLPGVKQVSNDAATSMFTLEEVKNEKERLNRAVERGDAPEEEDAVPDREATRALTPDDLERMKNARNAFAEGQDETMTASAVEHGRSKGKKKDKDEDTGATRKDGKTQKDGKTVKEGKAARTKEESDQTLKRARPSVPPDPEAARKRKKALVLVLALVGGIVVVGGGIAAWAVLFRKMPLEVVTAPPGALVVVDGVERGNAPVTVPVSRGAHAVKARLDGYQESQEVVDVQEARNVVLALKRLEATAPVNSGEDPLKAKAEALYLEGKALLDKGRLDDAQVKFEAMGALTPDDPRVAEMLAEIEKRRGGKGRNTGGGRNSGGRNTGGNSGGNTGSEEGSGNTADDAAYARMKPAQRKKEAQKAYDQARTAYDSGDMARAKELLTRCLRYDPSAVGCHRAMARVYTKEDNTPKVKYHLDRYLELGGADEDFKVRDWLRAH